MTPTLQKFLFFTILLTLLVTPASRAATIVIVNKDLPNVGFNDATPAAPVGGNGGVTLGQQRLNVFQAAASIWGAKLGGNLTIKVAASFGPLTPCSSSSGVLGSAGPTQMRSNFSNAPRLNTWYPVALASTLSGTDFAAGLPDGASIEAEFNSNVGTATCLPSTNWYLGLDRNHGGSIDLLTVLLHEFGHGLGFLSLADPVGGTFGGGTTPDVFSSLIFDNTTLMRWTAMSSVQRVTSSTNNGNVVFDGSNTTAGASILIAGKDAQGHPKLFTPAPVQQGSSIGHFDTAASPNQLMEPMLSDDLTHNVDLPNDLTTKVMLDIGWPVAASSAPLPPTNVVVFAMSGSTASVSWSASNAATGYRVFRRSTSGGTYTLVADLGATTSHIDTVSSNTVYQYVVRAVNGGGESANSLSDFTYIGVFTDPTLNSSVSVKLVHFTELQTAVNALRGLAGLTAFSFSAPSPANGVTVRKAHVDGLVTALNEARGPLGGGAISIGETLNVGSTTIKASHLTALRNGTL